MIRAIREGRKTQTRRIMRYQPPNIDYSLSRLVDTTSRDSRRHGGKLHWIKVDGYRVIDSDNNYFNFPYGPVGGRLWVKECHRFVDSDYRIGVNVLYEADGISLWKKANPHIAEYRPAKKRPSIFMHRWASRILLEIIEVKVQRLQEITEADAQAEGVEALDGTYVSDFAPHGYRKSFSISWDAINSKRAPWKSNPMVWVISFKVIN